MPMHVPLVLAYSRDVRYAVFAHDLLVNPRSPQVPTYHKPGGLNGLRV